MARISLQNKICQIIEKTSPEDFEGDFASDVFSINHKGYKISVEDASRAYTGMAGYSETTLQSRVYVKSSRKTIMEFEASFEVFKRIRDHKWNMEESKQKKKEKEEEDELRRNRKQLEDSF